MYQGKLGLDTTNQVQTNVFDYDEDEQRRHYFNMEVDKWDEPCYTIGVITSDGEHKEVSRCEV